jgi:ubiquinone/menaquinone biosynthesis C-methylase UbiE
MTPNNPTDLKNLQRTWDIFGKSDPMFAILYDLEKRRGKWDPQEFFESGCLEIQGIVDYLHALGVSLPKKTCLDFGCGMGRLTQAMAGHFDKSVGVDIAPSMIELAREHNTQGERCKFILNDVDNLEIFDDDSFNFVYSNKVLQHMKPEYSSRYLKEFLRVLKPGGVTVFQLPSEKSKIGEARSIRTAIRDTIRRTIPVPILELYRSKRYCSSAIMDMYCTPREQVERIVTDSGAYIKDVIDDGGCGPAFVSLRYCVVKH